MQKFPVRIQISIGLLIVALAIVIGAVTAYYNQYALLKELENRTDEQYTSLVELAEITDRNGTDDATAELVSDCAQRTEYESLLVKLDTLNARDLLTLQGLSASCGTYYPMTKAIMVSKLEREFEAYTEFIELIKLLDGDNLERFSSSEWVELIELEHKRSDLLQEQTEIQSEIIALLIQGLSPRGGIIQEQIKDAQRINILLVTYDTRIDELRATLTQ